MRSRQPGSHSPTHTPIVHTAQLAVEEKFTRCVKVLGAGLNIVQLSGLRVLGTFHISTGSCSRSQQVLLHSKKIT